MSARFGEIRQIAFIVPDIDAAVAYWTETLGIAPWYVKRNVQFADFRLDGQDAPSPTISIALSNSGARQIELIAQHCDTPSAYLGHTGFHHVSSWLSAEAFDARREALLAEGLPLAMEGRIPASGVRVAYWRTDTAPGGLIYEIADLDQPHHQERLAGIERAAAEWDGTPRVIETDK